MTNLTYQAKEAVIAKALARGETPLKEIAVQHGVGYSTLQKWLRLQREGQPLPGNAHPHPVAASDQKAPLQHLLDTAKLDEQALGAYCRQHGIHSFQLTQWRTELMEQKNHSSTNKVALEMKKLRQENKRLQKELNRKDKALAETTALLVMKKKADLIFGVQEDD